MVAHAKLGASGAYRWMTCPGSIKLSEGMPNESSVYAQHGSAAHALCEFLLENRNENGEDYLGHFINGEGDFFKPGDEAKTDDAFEIDQEMVDSVNIYLEAVLDEYDENILVQDTFLYVEESFDLSFIRPNMFGTNDASVFVPREFLTVSDFKYGRGKVVEAENNEQGMYYALGALHKLCWNEELGDYDPDILPREVVIQIIQPRAHHPDGPVRSWTVPVEKIIKDFAEELREAADRTTMPNAELRAGDHCFFCPAKAICPEIKEEAERALQTDFDDIDEELTDEELEDMGKEKARAISEDAEAIGEAMRVIPLMDAYIKAVEGYALNLAKGGEKVPGQKLVRKGTRRKWTDPEAAQKELAKHLKPDQYMDEPKLLSFTKIEKLKGMKSVVADLVHAPEGGLTLAPISDKREEVEIDPGKDFEDLDEDAN